MKWYERVVFKREPINRFGKLGFVSYLERVKTDDIAPFNKGKKILFREAVDAPYFLNLDSDIIYFERLDYEKNK